MKIPPIEILPHSIQRTNWLFNVVAPLFPTEVLMERLKALRLHYCFSILPTSADFNPKSRADSPTAMNFKTAIFPLLRLSPLVRWRFSLLLFFTHHGAVLQKHKLRTIVLTHFCDNTPDTVLCFPGYKKIIAVIILYSPFVLANLYSLHIDAIMIFFS